MMLIQITTMLYKCYSRRLSVSLVFSTEKYITYTEHFLSYEGAVKFSFVQRILAANSNLFNRNEVIKNPAQRFLQEDFVTVQVGHTNSQRYKKAIWFESEMCFFCYPGLRPRLLIYKRAASTFSIHNKNADAAIYNLNVRHFRCQLYKTTPYVA